MIERTVPLLTHFQISEAFHRILNDVVPVKIIEFDNHKLNELLNFNTKYGNQEANLKGLKQRLGLFSKYFLKQGRGTLPFAYGRDYAPNMLQS